MGCPGGKAANFSGQVRAGAEAGETWAHRVSLALAGPPSSRGPRRIPMLLKASCHCQAVRFSVESREPVPFMRCYCSICRKTAGTGGFAINLGADHATLKVDGIENVSVYRATMQDGQPSSGHRHFCKQCGTACGSGIRPGPSSCTPMQARSTPRCPCRRR